MVKRAERKNEIGKYLIQNLNSDHRLEVQPSRFVLGQLLIDHHRNRDLLRFRFNLDR